MFSTSWLNRLQHGVLYLTVQYMPKYNCRPTYQNSGLPCAGVHETHNIQQHHVHISYIAFHPNQTEESMDTNSLTSVSKARRSLRQLCRICQLIKILWAYVQNCNEWEEKCVKHLQISGTRVSKVMSWMRHVMYGETRDSCKVLVWKPDGKRPLGRPSRT